MKKSKNSKTAVIKKVKDGGRDRSRKTPRLASENTYNPWKESLYEPNLFL